MVPPKRRGRGVTRELRYVGIRVGGGIPTIRLLQCLPLQILELNKRTPQLFAVSCKNVARTLCDVWIASQRIDISSLVFNAPPETSHMLLHSLQFKERRHNLASRTARFSDAQACDNGVLKWVLRGRADHPTVHTKRAPIGKVPVSKLQRGLKLRCLTLEVGTQGLCAAAIGVGRCGNRSGDD